MRTPAIRRMPVCLMTATGLFCRGRRRGSGRWHHWGDVRATIFRARREILWEETQEAFAASDISSVIALEKFENNGERTKADETIESRQLAGPKRVGQKRACFLRFLKTAAETPCLPAKFDPRRELKQLQYFQALTHFRHSFSTDTVFFAAHSSVLAVFLEQILRW